jgi:hypothetical protein
MDTSQVYILVAIVVAAAILVTILVFGRVRGRQRLTPLAGLALAFVLSGLVFGDEPWIAYSLMGAGVLVALVDMVRRRRRHP